MPLKTVLQYICDYGSYFPIYSKYGIVSSEFNTACLLTMIDAIAIQISPHLTLE